ncbi:GAF domain-containing protein [Sphaerisporangium sp. NPDC051011]|uniref:GAF domain-containing protein n=1 Tax=Sphaerisporangium sp. NPDC051011 TaxID=3155792 RepID=UPI0033FD6A2C
MDGKPAGQRVRASVLDSWRRCQAVGLSPDTVQPRLLEDLDFECGLVRAARPVFQQLQTTIAGTAACVFLGDAKGVIFLRTVGDPGLRRALDAVGAAPGSSYAEADVGTTAFSSALVERRPCQIVGGEHFAEALRWITGMAAPVRDPLSGRVSGVVGITCPNERANAELMAFAQRSATAVERRLLDMATDRERALLEAFVRERGVKVAHPVPGSELRDLSPRDRLALQEAALNLVAQGRAAVVEVGLSDGRAATLVAQPVTGGSPREAPGIAVLAWFSNL